MVDGWLDGFLREMDLDRRSVSRLTPPVDRRVIPQTRKELCCVQLYLFARCAEIIHSGEHAGTPEGRNMEMPGQQNKHSTGWSWNLCSSIRTSLCQPGTWVGPQGTTKGTQG